MIIKALSLEPWTYKIYLSNNQKNRIGSSDLSSPSSPSLALAPPHPGEMVLEDTGHMLRRRRVIARRGTLYLGYPEQHKPVRLPQAAGRHSHEAAPVHTVLHTHTHTHTCARAPPHVRQTLLLPSLFVSHSHRAALWSAEVGLWTVVE